MYKFELCKHEKEAVVCKKLKKSFYSASVVFLSEKLEEN